MSKGTKVVPVRINETLLDEVRRAMEKRNAVTRKEPWTLSMFIREAVEQKLDHIYRSRKQVRNKAEKKPAVKGGES